MKKSTFLRSLLTLLVMAVWGTSAMAQSWVKVTNSSQLIVGDKYIIVNEANNKAMGEQKNNNRGTTAITISNGTITSLPADAAVFILGGDKDQYTFKVEGSGKYLYAASTSSNHLKETTTTTNNNAKAKITFESNGDATIKFNQSERNWIRYNPNNGSPLFSCYTSGQQAVQLYHYVENAGPTKDLQTLSFNENACTAEVGSPFTPPTLTGAMTTVTYSSSNEDVATVNNDGMVTLVGKGTTTITATAEETDDYYSASASYTLKVTEPLPEGTIWYEDFSSNSLDIYTAQNAQIYATGTAYANGEVPELLLKGDNGELTATINNLKGYTGTFALTFISNHSYRCSVSSSTEGVNVSKVSSEDDKLNARFEVYVPEGTSTLSLTFSNNTGDNARIDNILLEHLYDLQTLTISSVGYATYSSDKAYIMPSTMKGGVVNVQDGTAIVDYFYTQNVLVPVGTGLLIQGEAGKHKFFATDRTNNTNAGTNLLKGALTNDPITAPAGSSLYIFANDSESGLGFYWQKNSNNGQQVQNMAGKAYLQVPTTSAVKGFRLNLGDTTGITAVETTNGNAPVYTLSGVRVNGSLNNLPAGIYIVGGKKVYVK